MLFANSSVISDGYVQTDGHSGYDFLDHKKKIRHIVCWAHVRRKFTDVVKAREKSFNFDEIRLMRMERAKPILEEFKVWLSKKSLQTPPKGLLGKAVSYTLNQWDKLVGYLEDGRLAPDNNMAENSIRPFVIGRKNWLFSGTPEGAEASALLYSLIETAKANNLEPYAYLRYISTNCPWHQCWRITRRSCPGISHRKSWELPRWQGVVDMALTFQQQACMKPDMRGHFVYERWGSRRKIKAVIWVLSLACKKLKVSQESHHKTNELHIRACLGVSQDTGSAAQGVL